VTEIEAFRMTIPIVFSYTVPIKWDSSTADDNIGAGVLLALNGRTFVISAAHCLNKNPVVLEQDSFLPISDNKIPIIRKETHSDLDIGFLEVDNCHRRPVLNRGTSLLEQFWLATPPDHEQLNTVGFPVSHRRSVMRDYYCDKRIVGTTVTKSEGDRYYLDYPEKGYSWDQTKNDFEQVDFPKTPVGFSGGGWWGFVLSKPDELFSPEKHIRLYAIQSAWLPKRRTAVCIPIRHFLAMLYSCYPDLQQELLTRFPSEAFRV
jgi:hypothetical protein